MSRPGHVRRAAGLPLPNGQVRGRAADDGRGRGSYQCAGRRASVVGVLVGIAAGGRDNPSLRTIEALARFFGVPATYFFDDGTAEEVRSQLELLTQIRESGVTGLKFRGTDFTSEGRSAIVKLLQQLAADQQAAAARMLQAAGTIEDEVQTREER